MAMQSNVYVPPRVPGQPAYEDLLYQWEQKAREEGPPRYTYSEVFSQASQYVTTLKNAVCAPPKGHERVSEVRVQAQSWQQLAFYDQSGSGVDIMDWVPGEGLLVLPDSPRSKPHASHGSRLTHAPSISPASPGRRVQGQGSGDSHTQGQMGSAQHAGRHRTGPLGSRTPCTAAGADPHGLEYGHGDSQSSANRYAQHMPAHTGYATPQHRTPRDSSSTDRSSGGDVTQRITASPRHQVLGAPSSCDARLTEAAEVEFSTAHTAGHAALRTPRADIGDSQAESTGAPGPSLADAAFIEFARSAYQPGERQSLLALAAGDCRGPGGPMPLAPVPRAVPKHLREGMQQSLLAELIGTACREATSPGRSERPRSRDASLSAFLPVANARIRRHSICIGGVAETGVSQLRASCPGSLPHLLMSEEPTLPGAQRAGAATTTPTRNRLATSSGAVPSSLQQHAGAGRDASRPGFAFPTSSSPGTQDGHSGAGAQPLPGNRTRRASQGPLPLHFLAELRAGHGLVRRSVDGAPADQPSQGAAYRAGATCGSSGSPAAKVDYREPASPGSPLIGSKSSPAVAGPGGGSSSEALPRPGKARGLSLEAGAARAPNAGPGSPTGGTGLIRGYYVGGGGGNLDWKTLDCMPRLGIEGPRVRGACPAPVAAPARALGSPLHAASQSSQPAAGLEARDASSVLRRCMLATPPGKAALRLGLRPSTSDAASKAEAAAAALLSQPPSPGAPVYRPSPRGGSFTGPALGGSAAAAVAGSGGVGDASPGRTARARQRNCWDGAAHVPASQTVCTAAAGPPSVPAMLTARGKADKQRQCPAVIGMRGSLTGTDA